MKLIVIDDAGHAGSGITPGKRTPDGSMYEWDFNNAVREYVKNSLLTFQNVEVHTVSDPTGKRDVPLTERTNKANAIYSRYKGDKNTKVIYISYHANAYGTGWNNVRGLETFVYKTNPSGSRKLADAIHKNLVEITGLSNRGVKTADFHVLRETHMDAILIEGGFMTNKDDAAKLKSTDYRVKFASAVVCALEELYQLKPKQAVKGMAAERELNEKEKEIQTEAMRLGITDGKNPFREVNQMYVWSALIPLARKIEKLEKK
jgi:N-acetylmuramoyl-L-alanine amidase